MGGGRIVKVSGPLVIASDLTNVRMYDVVKVGLPQLIGEVMASMVILLLSRFMRKQPELDLMSQSSVQVSRLA